MSHQIFISKDSTCFYVPLNDKRQGAGVQYSISDRELELPSDKSQNNYCGARPRLSTKEPDPDTYVEKRWEELANALAHLGT